MEHHIEDTPVLIVGGGLVGLSAALFLQHQGIPFILVERRDGVSPLPRARGIAARTMELFRQVGLQEAVEAAAKAAWEQGSFGGGRRGGTLLSAEALEVPDGGKFLTGDDPSPCTMQACPQTSTEPVLKSGLTAPGSDARFGWRLQDFSQDEQGVTACVLDPAGTTRTLHARYLIAADGGRSPVRHRLAVARPQDGGGDHLLNIFFEADLAERVRGKTFSQCEVANDRVSGLFLAMNNTTRWSFHLRFDPDVDRPDTWSDADVVERVQAAVGEEVPVTLRYREPWSTNVRIAERYRGGRVFLVGDAAHTMPPWGGFNANTGIADAHNLAWKLAAVLQDGADEGLLDSYEAERRPVALRNGAQARLRTDFEARLGIRTEANAPAFAQMLDGGALQMRYRYDAGGSTVKSLQGQPGTRFPHAWIDHAGERRSTLDLFGKGEVTLAGPYAPKDPVAGRLCAGRDFRFADPSVTWRELTGRQDDAVIRVRPDGFVVADTSAQHGSRE